MGEIRVESNQGADGGVKPKVSMRMNDEGSATTGADRIPLDYDLEITSTPLGNLFAFSEGTDEKAVAIEGTIQHECKVMPVMNENYRKIMRQRRIEAEKPKRTTLMFEASGTTRMVSMAKGNISISQPSVSSKVAKQLC